MITIIHGDDTAASRNFFQTQKKNLTNTITLDGAAIAIQDIAQALSSDGLFVESKNIFIDELFSKRKASHEFEEILLYIENHHENATLYLWESKEIQIRQLKQLKSAINRNFKLPSSIFAFLDGLKPNNSKMLIQLFHKTLEYKDEQFIFFMLVRHMRMLLALSEDTTDTINDEIKKMQPWQKTKLQKQAKFFTSQFLQTFYAKLFAIDLALKTGHLACPLNQTIDFLLLEI